MKQSPFHKNSLQTKNLFSLRLVGYSFIGALLIAGVYGVMGIQGNTETVSGYVFVDYDENGVEDGYDMRPPVITINVYSDQDGSGTLSPGDKILGSGLSDGNGNYSVEIDYSEDPISQRIDDGDDDVEESVTNGGDLYTTSSDLEMVYDGSNKQVIGIRYREVNLPPAATITSAKIRFKAKDESNSGNTLTIFGEKAGDSEPFFDKDYNLTKRKKVATSVTWNTGAWGKNSTYDSPDLKEVIREIIDLPGWIPGNPLTFMVEGNSGTKNAYSGTSKGPELVIMYTLPTTDYIVAVDSNCLKPGSIINPIALSKGSNSNLNLCFTGEGPHCYAVSDDNPNHLVYINRFSGKNRPAMGGGKTGADEIEGIAFDPFSNDLYGANNNRLGTINLVTGNFTEKSQTFGTGTGAEGSISFGSIDAMSFDPLTGELWGIHRRDDKFDVLFKINPTTGQFIPDVYGANIDYVVVTGPNVYKDIDDFGVDAIDGTFYATNTQSGKAFDYLITIDPTTGAAAVVDTITFEGNYIRDLEGSGFTNYGLFVVTSGENGSDYTDNSMFTMDLQTAEVKRIGRFNSGGDYESCDCLSFLPNKLQGKIFNDVNNNGKYDVGEMPFEAVKLRINLDSNDNGELDEGERLIDSVYSDFTGNYTWETVSNRNFLVEVVPDISQISPLYGFSNTTEGKQNADFSNGFGGQFNSDNDFGFINADLLPVEWADISAEWIDQNAQISWATASETQNQHFIVERSEGDDFFLSLDKVDAVGESGKLTEYTYLDREVGSVTSRSIIYRIKQVDVDGASSFSPVVELLIAQADTRLEITKLYPNPATDRARVAFRAPGNELLDLKVISLSGQTVFAKTGIRGDQGEVVLPVSDWAAGIYIVQIFDENRSIQKKLMVK